MKDLGVCIDENVKWSCVMRMAYKHSEDFLSSRQVSSLDEVFKILELDASNISPGDATNAFENPIQYMGRQWVVVMRKKVRFPNEP